MTCLALATSYDIPSHIPEGSGNPFAECIIEGLAVSSGFLEEAALLLMTECIKMAVWDIGCATFSVDHSRTALDLLGRGICFLITPQVRGDRWVKSMVK